MAQYYEDFRNAVPLLPYGGFTAHISRSGDSIVVLNDAEYGKYLAVMKGATGGSLAVGWDVLDGAQDVEILTKFRITGADPTLGRYGILYGRYDGTSEATTRGYAATFTPTGSNTPSIILNEDSIGTVNYTTYSWQNNKVYWARLRINGNDQKFKIWEDGAPEPTTWLLESTYSGPTIASPYSGIGNYNSSSQMQVFQISAGTGGDPAPKSLAPASTPMGVIGGGYGGIGGYGDGYGMGTRAAFTVEHLDQAGNARIERVVKKTQTGNARIQRTENITQSGQARIERVESVQQSANARIERTEALTQPANAHIERIEQLSQDGNATLESFYFTADIDQSADARIERVEQISQTGNALIEKAKSIDQPANAFIEWQKTLQQPANARLERIEHINQTGNAKLYRIDHLDQMADAFIEWQLKLTQSGNARIGRIHTIDQTGSAVLYRIDQLQQVGDARIERTESIGQTGNAKIRNPVPDKRPQQWEDASTEQPAEWTGEDPTPHQWENTEDKRDATWKNSDDRQKQQWSDSDNKKPQEWRRQFYD